MRFITDQVDIIRNAMVLQKPIITLVKSTYSGSILFEKNDKVSFDISKLIGVDEMVIEEFKRKVNVTLMIEQKSYRTRIDDNSFVGTILNRVEDHVLHFLKENGGFVNNRLSNIYKWYKEKVTANAMRNNEKLAQDLYNIAKFVNAATSEEHIKAGRTLLAIIKDRYEPILGSI